MNSAPMTVEERRIRLKDWLEKVHGSVTEAVVNQRIFWEVQQIIRDNPQLQSTSSAFYDWMASTFAHSTVLAVRRQLDTHRNSVSLHRVLLEVQKFPELISRSYHLSIYARPEFTTEYAEHMANYTYDTQVGKDASKLDASAIGLEITSLKAASEAVHHYADRVVAHYDIRGLERDSPKFDDLTDSLSVIEKLVLRYGLLLNGASQTSLLPTFQYDWKSVFRIAWLPQK
jgi:hypothetical protein